MLSSLGLLGRYAYQGPRIAPVGTRSSFLSFSAPQAQVGGADLATLLQMVPGGVQNVDERHQHVPSAPPPVLRVSRAVPMAGAGAIPAGGVGAFDLRHISEGKFTEATIKNMHKAVLDAKTNAQWRELMETIRQEGRRQGAIGWKDYLGEQRWFNHFYRNVRPIDYVRDPHQVELVMHPKWTFKKALGDCVPLDQKVLVRHRETNSYVVLAVGELKERYADYDAVSYSEKCGRFEFSPITAWIYKGRKPVVRVTKRSGNGFRCTPDHRTFGLFKDSNKRRVQLLSRPIAEAARLSHNRFLGQAMAHKLPALHSTNTISSYQLYVEGMYVAEGYSEYPSRAEISNKNPDIIGKLKSCLSMLGIPFRQRERKDGVILLYIKASYLSKRLHQQFGTSSATKRFPDEYLSLSQEDIATAVSAYADGDGYIPRDGSAWSRRVRTIYNTTSEELKEQLLLMHLVLGRPLSIYRQESSMGAGKSPLPIWRLLDRRIYERAHLERLPNLESARIKVRDDGEAEVCDISVAENHNFLTADGHLLHNCDDSATLWSASMGALGAPHKFRTYRADPRRPNEWSHVVAQTWVPGHGWINNDLTIKGAAPGYEPKGYPFKDWHEPQW